MNKKKGKNEFEKGRVVELKLKGKRRERVGLKEKETKH